MPTIKGKHIDVEYVNKPYSSQCSCRKGSLVGRVRFWLKEIWFIFISLYGIILDLVAILLASLTSVMCRCCTWIQLPSKYYCNITESEEWLELLDDHEVHKDTIQGYDNIEFENDISNSQMQELNPMILDHDDESSIGTNDEIQIQTIQIEESDIQQNEKCSRLQHVVQHARETLCKRLNLTDLHQAVMESNVRAFVEISEPEEIEILLKEETTLDFLGKFRKKGARFPLALAVLIGNKDSVHELIKVGAELDHQDMYGYTVFHTVVLMSATDYETASEMYDFLIDQAKIWWEKKEVNGNVCPDMEISQMEAVYYLLNIKTNSRQLTPLELAASLGYKKIMEKILNTEYAYKFTIFRSKKREIAFYDVKDIDPVLDASRLQPSVIELIVASENYNALECFDIPLMDGLLSRKWNNYFLYFVAEAIAYFIFLCIYTSNVYNQTYVQNATTNATIIDYIFEFRFSATEIVLIVGGFLYGLIGLTLLVSTVTRVFRRGIQYGSLSLLWRRLLLAVQMVAIASVLFFWLLAKIKNWAIQRIFQVLTLIFGWTFLIFFMHGFRRTAFFSVMVQKILVKDVLLFALCFTVITVAFASAIMVNVRFNGKYSPNYKSIENAFFSLFRMSLGLADPVDLFDRQNFTMTTYALNVAMFTGYIILCFVLLLNMLIACMTHTYKKISKQKHLFWKRLRAFNVYLIEQRLPTIFQRISNYYPVKTYEIKDKNGKVFKRDVCMFRI